METLKTVLPYFLGLKISEKERLPTEEEEERNYGKKKHGEEAAERPEDEEFDVKKLGFFDSEGQFWIRKGEQSKLFTHFKNFYVHRIGHVGQMKKYSRDFQPMDERDPHKPTISQKSHALAEKKRKEKHGDKQNVNIVDILLTPIQQTDPDWIESQRKQLDDKHHDGCTFRPQTLDYSGNGVKESTHGDKCLDLYTRVPKGKYAEKQMKSTQEYEFEKYQ